ncbi:hypothetical protein HDU85_007142 [Gaertneriomyces sp. JEL0708]|nr:hypothetical protein HDU85_007142 [Gaertneriomyces sp. JEL0708]
MAAEGNLQGIWIKVPQSAEGSPNMGRRPIKGPADGNTGSEGPSNEELLIKESTGDLHKDDSFLNEAGDVLLELGIKRQKRPLTRQPTLRSDKIIRTRSVHTGPKVHTSGAKTLPSRWFRRAWEDIPWPSLDEMRRCTKAVLAFLICVVAVLVDPIAAKVGPNAHLAPFAVLFFPPVRSVGGTLETTIIGVLGVIFGAAVSLAAQAANVAYNITRPDNEPRPIGSSFILLTFLAFGVFTVGYMRASYPRLQNATVTSCTIMVFPITSNIYARTKIVASVWDIAVPFFFGAAVCLMVAVVVMPEFSGQVLRKSIQTTVKEMRELLQLLVDSFLLQVPDDTIPLDEIFEKQARVREALSRTKAARSQCRYEITYDRYSPQDYKTVVMPLQESMKYLSGMVACLKIEKALMEKDEGVAAGDGKGTSVFANLQEQLRKQSESKKGKHDFADLNNLTAKSAKSLNNLTVQSTRSGRSYKSTSAQLEEEIREGHHVEISGREISEGLFGGSKKLFQRYIESVQPSVQALADACTTCMDEYAGYMLGTHGNSGRLGVVARTAETIRRARRKISKTRGDHLGPVGESIVELRMNELGSVDELDPEKGLRRALTVFEEMQWNVIERVSQQKNPLEMSSPSGLNLSDDRPDNTQNDEGDIADPEDEFWNAANMFREEYLLAFFFIFNFRESAKKVKKFVDAVDGLKNNRQGRKRFWLPHMKLAAWLKGNSLMAKEHDADMHAADIPLYTQGKETFIAPGWLGKARFRLWQALKGLSNHSVKFGVKMMIATISLAWPAYVWPDFWITYRGTWALVALILVLSPTVGGSNIFALYRIIGTVFGAIWGFVTWKASQGSPYVIAVMTTIWAYPWWYVFVTTNHQRLGLTALTTYNIIVMLAYRTRNAPSPETEIVFLTLSRMTTVTIGVVAALIVTSYMWPFVARIELRENLSKTVYTMGILYSRLALLIAAEEELRMDPSTPDGGTNPHYSHYIAMKHQKGRQYIRRLERKLAKSVQSHLELLSLTRHEPRLKGPFPYEVYEQMLWTIQNLIDRMGNIRRIVDGEYSAAGRSLDKEEGFGDFVRAEIIKPLDKYRMDMFAAILLYFHVIAGSLNAKTPLPAFLPAARAARLRLFGKLKTLPGLRDASLSDRKDQRTHFLYFMAYELATEDMIEEVEDLADNVKQLFGQSSLANDLVTDYADIDVQNMQPSALAVRPAVVDAMPSVAAGGGKDDSRERNMPLSGRVPLTSSTHG